MKKVLIVDDEFLIRFTLEEGLKDRGYETQSAETVKDALEKMKTFHPQVILLDNRLQDSLGIDEISTFRSADEEVQVILMTAYGSVAQAVEATKRGAYDYILKPFDIDEIDRIASRCISQMQDRESLEFLKGKTQEFIGVSDAAMRIRRHIELLGKNSTVNVLIRGETGTGKEVAASLIHACSDRREHLMVRINCSAIPEHLMESELFGYERGAFTGANREGKPGLFEVANEGTIFLDEVGELSLATQTKLLRVLQEKEITRVGGSKPMNVDVRVIAATNRDLQKCVTEGTFREDLYYRLSVFPVWVPPLRQRKLDIPKLARSVIDELNQTYEHKKSLTAGAEATLLRYSWPGNVRELRNVMERAFIMSDGEQIQAEDLAILDNGDLHTPKTIQPSYGVAPVPRSSYAEDTEAALSPEPLTPPCPAAGPVLTDEPLQEQVARYEAALIAQAMQQEGSLRGAARKLHMDPATLLRRKKKYQQAGLIGAEV